VRLPRAMSAVITRYVLAILVVTMLLGFGLYSQVTRNILDKHTERLALVVAQSVAANQSVRSEMATGDKAGAVQRTAERIRAATGAAYVVVIDRAGVRHSHPNPALFG
jgi:two-component system CitB family sensor kinase